ncbi:thermonuclease family protein [Granulicatella seriolae]|uniref:Thermonuclease family protein n=1 Tax=Granulicatella seriolae TaxID=2967226 RepID=A0ABT1WPB3_9LACT|nr:thermonuclease family protein [Granulicatella seriolae]
MKDNIVPNLFANLFKNNHYPTIILVLIIAFVLSRLPIFTDKDQGSNSDLTTTGTSHQVKAFDGKDFSVFEKSTRYPFHFVSVSDGDTFRLSFEGKSFKVRLLVVNAPETAKADKPAQPWAQKAKERTEELLSKAKVIEASFDLGPYTDTYGRALLYVYVDGCLLQDILLEEGLVNAAYQHKPSVTLVPQMLESQAKAQKEFIGIWERPDYVTDHGFDVSVYD